MRLYVDISLLKSRGRTTSWEASSGEHSGEHYYYYYSAYYYYIITLKSYMKYTYKHA